MEEKREEFEEISPSDFFYRNRDLAGFTNPARSLYSAVREFVENSLDACELYEILPDIVIGLTEVETRSPSPNIYKLMVADNGPGVPQEVIPFAFGKVLYGSKFTLRQTRGMFGLGGTMAILYGQITTNKSAHVVSSTGTSKIYEFTLSIDILHNEPVVLKRRVANNDSGWHGTVIDIYLEGDYMKASSRIIEYLKQTAIVNPHADITFFDPYGRLFKFDRNVAGLASPPREVKPHPQGIDVEMFRRLVFFSEETNMLDFLVNNFQRVGRVVVNNFLKKAGIPPSKDPKTLNRHEIVTIVQKMRSFYGFRKPRADCLSSLGEDFIIAGIQREYNPEFVTVVMQPPSSYSGHPFIVEVAVAYGGNIPSRTGGLLYRFTNKIPLLYDEGSDVAWKVMRTLINWKNYKVNIEEDPIAVFVYLFSTKIPYKTVGKECVADRPEIEREMLSALRKACRRLRAYLSRKGKAERKRKKLEIFSKYLSQIARFSTSLAGKEREPDVTPLLRELEVG
jgi:DNA topoisomerase-6 subunit B